MIKGKQMTFKIVVSYQSNGTLFYPTIETIYIIYERHDARILILRFQALGGL